MMDRHSEDRWFAAEVMLVYRLTSSRYYTHDYMMDKEEVAGETYSIIDAYKSRINRNG